MTALSLQILKYQHQVTHIAHSYWSVVGFYHIEEQCPWLIHSRLLLFDLVNEWYASQWYGFVRGCSKSTDCVNVASNLNCWFSSFHSMAGRGYCHQLNWCILVYIEHTSVSIKIPIFNYSFKKKILSPEKFWLNYCNIQEDCNYDFMKDVCHYHGYYSIQNINNKIF